MQLTTIFSGKHYWNVRDFPIFPGIVFNRQHFEIDPPLDTWIHIQTKRWIEIWKKIVVTFSTVRYKSGFHLKFLIFRFSYEFWSCKLCKNICVNDYTCYYFLFILLLYVIKIRHCIMIASFHKYFKTFTIFKQELQEF